MKTKLGISTAFLAAVTYLLGFFAGYVALVLVTGYILLCEEDAWLKKTAVKAVVVCLAFSVISALINLIPNAMSLLDDFVSIFGGSFHIVFISRIISFINTLITVAEKLIMLGLAALALKNKTVKIPKVDDFVEKHM